MFESFKFFFVKYAYSKDRLLMNGKNVFKTRSMELKFPCEMIITGSFVSGNHARQFDIKLGSVLMGSKKQGQ